MAANEWLKISEWRYLHESREYAIDHDTEGWILSSPTLHRMWPTAFAKPEDAMEFAGREIGLVKA